MAMQESNYDKAQERLDAWLEKVETQGRGELQNFVQGLKRDYDAVKAALCQNNLPFCATSFAGP